MLLDKLYEFIGIPQLILFFLNFDCASTYYIKLL